jgi:hypothetical protein
MRYDQNLLCDDRFVFTRSLNSYKIFVVKIVQIKILALANNIFIKVTLIVFFMIFKF